MFSKVKLEAAGRTDQGLVRTTNQDQFIVAQIRRILEVSQSSLPSEPSRPHFGGPVGHLLVVADGVGGGAAGDRASALALQSFLQFVSESMQIGQVGGSLEDDLLAQFSQAIGTAHARVRREIEQRPELSGMATTLTMAYVLGLRAYISHVGDSRCYLLRDGEALRLTRDQTYAQELVDQGVLLPSEVDESRWSHVLASAVGGQSQEQPEILTYRCLLEPGDALLLCTDGLTKHVDEAELAESLSGRSANEACDHLVTRALEAGGTDNVTVVLARVLAD